VLAVTVDVDGEAGLPDGGSAFGERLTSRSERVFGVVRGLPRVLDVLAAFDVHATFYVPGVTALRHPDAVASIVAGGHELGHHGHTHRLPHTLSEASQREEIEAGIAALGAVSGYRAPGWELTPTTLELLVEHGFGWDSSLMGDDRPYRVGPLIELPVHWSLDDAPFLAAPGGDPDLLERVWLRELASAAAEARPLTLTLHPEILGRRPDILSRVLERALQLGFRTVTHGQLAATV
jgi:peptidoglycan/xylan/chitin deacetylase (PgdA/CDA1 family)